MSGSVVRRLSNEAVSCRIATRGSSSMAPGLCLLVEVPQSQSTWMVKPAKPSEIGQLHVCSFCALTIADKGAGRAANVLAENMDCHMPRYP